MTKTLYKFSLNCVWATLLLFFSIQRTDAQFITIGTGTTTTNGTGADPVCDYYEGLHYQTVYTASELSGAGLSSGASLTAMGFDISQSPGTLGNYTVKLALTSQSDAATYINPNTTTFTTVVAPFSYTPLANATAGTYDMINFTTNFIWDGTSNIVVDVCTGPSNPFGSPYGGVRVTTLTNGASYTRADAPFASTVCAQPTEVDPNFNYDGGVLGNRPNVRFNYVAGSNCSGMPNAGQAVASAAAVCTGQNFSLSLSGATSAGGLTYQWEESILGMNSWSPIGPATNASYTVTMGVDNMEYRCVVSCGAFSATSGKDTVMVNPYYNCPCASTVTYPTSDGEIFNVTYGQLNNTSNCTQTGGGPGSVVGSYSNYSNLTPDTIYQDQPYQLSVTAASCGGSYGGWVKVWIDLDHDGAFTTTGEEIMSMAPPGGNYTPAGVVTTSSPIISSTQFPLTGLARMRVVMMEGGSQAATTPCGSYGYGETEDYLVYIPGPAPTCNTVAAGTISKNKDSVCVNKEKFTITATGYTMSGSNLLYEWESSPTGQNIWTPVPGANTAIYTDTLTAASDYRFRVTCLTSSQTAVSAPVTIGTAAFYVCYCSPVTGTTLHSFGSQYISNVTVSSTTLNNNSTTAGTGGFTQYFPNVATQTGGLAQGVSYGVSVTSPYTGYGADVWVDFDMSGTFDNSEYFSLTTTGTTASGTIVVPTGLAMTGYTGMRVRNWYTAYGAGGACANTTGYETEDYVVNILPQPSCVPPSALQVTNVTSSTADIAWTSASSATQWQIQYGPTPFTLGTGTIINTFSNPHTITSGLNPATQYAFYVRGICGPNDTSTWTAGPNFTTACVTFVAPFTETFNLTTGTTPPLCWTVGVASSGGTWRYSGTLNNGYGTVGADHTGNSGGFAWVDGSSPIITGQVTTLTSPIINIAALTAPQVRYYMISYYDQALYGANNNRLVVEAWDYNLSSWVTIDSVQQIFASTAWQERTGSLASVTSTNTQLRFRFVGTATTTFYNDILIDDIHVEQMPTCVAPTNVVVNNPTTSSLDVNWVSSSSATQFQIEYAAGTGFTIGTGTRVGPVGVASPHTISSLNSGSPYTFYVRGICGVNDTSAWSTAITAFTSFPAIPANDDCVTPVDISNGALYYGSTSGATQTMAACDATANATDVWYSFTTGSTGGVIRDTVNTTNSGTDVVVQMFSGTCPSNLTPMIPTAGTTFNATNGCVDGPAAGIEWASYNVTASTTYFIRVYTYGTSTPGAFSIQVVGTPLAIKLDKITATNVGTANRIDWNTFAEERSDKFELERSIDGKIFTTIYSKQAKGEASRYSYMDNEAAKGTNYYRLRMLTANGSATYSEVVSAFVKSTGFDVEAFPNPVSQNLTVKVTGVQGTGATVQVLDVTGKLMRTVKMNSATETINMSGLANGVYLIKYSDASHTQTLRVSKQ